MKKYFCIALMIVSFLFSARLSGQQQFTITGTIADKYEGADLVLYSEDTTFNKLKTTVQNGRFSFSGSIRQDYQHTRLSVQLSGDSVPDIVFMLNGGEKKINIRQLKGREGGKNDIGFSGIPFLKQMQEFDAQIRPLEDSARRTFNLATKVRREPTGTLNADSLWNCYQRLRSQKTDRLLQYVKRNSDNYYGLYIFNEKIIFPSLIRVVDSLVAIYNGFNSSLQQTALGEEIGLRLRRMKSLLINQVLPDFSFITTSGEQYSLSSFRDKKYVLLCFWDSYCGPCIRSIPTLTKLNEQYKNKGLQLVSVSIDSDKEKWNRSLKMHPMSWMQTCDLPPYIEARVRTLYNIAFIPQYFLIDKEGKLIYQNVQMKDGTGYAILQQTLARLLNGE